ncbi:hypothetical protein ACFU9B_31370 [Streptomyces sp. NPDC057592]|uniref:hypothetical protein n=1 Tax=unclassified Streptomyces TaxID=2593676 RepID=UPI0036A6605B
MFPSIADVAVLSVADLEVPAPQMVGADEYATRKGRHCGLSQPAPEPSMTHRTSTKASATVWDRDAYTGIRADSHQATAADSGHPATHDWHHTQRSQSSVG